MTDAEPVDALTNMVREAIHQLRKSLLDTEQAELVFTQEQLGLVLLEYFTTGEKWLVASSRYTSLARMYGVRIQVLPLEEPIPNNDRLHELDRRGLLIDFRWFEV